MRQLLDNLKAFTDRFTFNQKILLGALAATLIVSIVIFSLWLQNNDKVVLFTNLSPEDAATAVDEIQKQNVQVELRDGGTTILVPENAVHRLRIELAAKGIPSSGTVGWGIFDGNQYGMTEFLQDVNYRRALEGELTKTIESIRGIRSARIHLVIPKQSIFKQNRTTATASVVLALGRGTVLSAQQIRGIQSLVAGSVEGLEIPNVTVLDQFGVVLSESLDGQDAAAGEGQLAIKKQVDGYLSQKAETMLARVLGPGKAIVRVDATLNFDRVQQQREIYDPDKAAIRSEEHSESTGSQDGSQETSTTNYELNRTLETVVGEVGGIKTLSVAVFVDGKYEQPEGGGEPTYTPLSEEELDQIRRVVMSAVGLDEERGDRIEVVSMRFQAPVETPEEGGLMGTPLLTTVSQIIGRVLLFILALLLALRLKNNLVQLAQQRYEPTQFKHDDSVLPSEELEELLEADEEIQMTERKLEEIRKYAGSKPDEVADLVHAWIGEAETG